MANYVGVVETYDDKESSESYMERFEQFLIVNDITEAKKVPSFLTVVGSKSYENLRNSLLPDAPSTKSYEIWKKTLLDYFIPQSCVIRIIGTLPFSQAVTKTRRIHFAISRRFKEFRSAMLIWRSSQRGHQEKIARRNGTDF